MLPNSEGAPLLRIWRSQNVTGVQRGQFEKRLFRGQVKSKGRVLVEPLLLRIVRWQLMGVRGIRGVGDYLKRNGCESRVFDRVQRERPSLYNLYSIAHPDLSLHCN
eukprot:757005-Hanusia_phi.AAC.1